MPPKKAPPKASKKNVQKEKERILEDKTFGLKNKNKSKKVQQYVSMVTNQAKGNESVRDKAMKEQKKREAEMKKAADAELASIFTEVIVQPKLKFGEDPKGVICVHFKAGNCTKGKSCKYSHDIAVAAKKSAKRNLNVDVRDVSKEDDTMDNWDENKLKDVVKKKSVAQVNATNIICKYFLEALDKELYGWFWVCPNGGDLCKYRHALPEGYVFKTKRQRDAERMEFLEAGGKTGLDVFEIIEIKRAALPKTGLTPVTLESLAKWKQDRIAKDKEIAEKKKKEDSKKKNYGPLGLMTGRALFLYDPTMFVDDEGAIEGEQYVVTGALNIGPEISKGAAGGEDDLEVEDVEEEEDGEEGEYEEGEEGEYEEEDEEEEGEEEEEEEEEEEDEEGKEDGDGDEVDNEIETKPDVKELPKVVESVAAPI